MKYKHAKLKVKSATHSTELCDCHKGRHHVDNQKSTCGLEEIRLEYEVNEREMEYQKIVGIRVVGIRIVEWENCA